MEDGKVRRPRSSSYKYSKITAEERNERLQKWKEEKKRKAETEAKEKSSQRPPFIVPRYFMESAFGGFGFPSVDYVAANIRYSKSSKKFLSQDKNRTVSTPKAKSQPKPQRVATDVPAKTAKPANNKNSSKSTPVISKTVQNVTVAEPVLENAQSESVNKEILQELTKQDTKNNQVSTKAELKLKNPKYMQLDEVYKTYHAYFVQACTKLMEYSTQYEEILKSSESEEVNEEIWSVLGKTKLLMESKLRKFAELLGWYLLKNHEPDTLATDLEGWWDTSLTQINELLANYKKLNNIFNILDDSDFLNANENSLKDVSEKPSKEFSKNSSSKIRRARMPSALVASPAIARRNISCSPGLKSFIARQRQDRANNNGNSEPEVEVQL